MKGYIFLTIAIVCEVFSTSMLKASGGFSKFTPGLAFIIGMAASFYTLAQALIYVPLNIAYAVWAGAGTVLTTLIAIFIWKELVNIYSIIGILLITAGVIILNIKGAGH